jgi:glucokinase
MTPAATAPPTLGIDFGGTNAKGVLVDAAGNVVAHESLPSHAGEPSRVAMVDLVRRLVTALSDRVGGARPERLGLAAPGLASTDGRRIAWLPADKLDIEGIDWTDALDWPTPVPVLNDAHAALLGEVWVGAARGARDAVLLTLGTGVGGAILCDGRLLRGAIGRAGHLGHTCLDVDGPPDMANTPGSIELAIGNVTIRERTHGRFDSTRALVEAAGAGDVEARAVWLRSVRALACTVASVVNAVDPSIVIIGGGIARAGADLFEPLTRELDRVEWRPHGHRVAVVPAALGEWAGALGAAWNAMNVGATPASPGATT